MVKKLLLAASLGLAVSCSATRESHSLICIGFCAEESAKLESAAKKGGNNEKVTAGS